MDVIFSGELSDMVSNAERLIFQSGKLMSFVDGTCVEIEPPKCRKYSAMMWFFAGNCSFPADRVSIVSSLSILFPDIVCGSCHWLMTDFGERDPCISK